MEQGIRQDNLIRIGSNIRELRMARGMSQEAMADALSRRDAYISRGTYSKIEMGARHITASQFEAIRDILDTTYEDLLKHTNQAP